MEIQAEWSLWQHYTACIIHADLKENIGSFRIGSSSSSMDSEVLVYKIDNTVQSSLVLILIQDSCYDLGPRVRIKDYSCIE